MSDRSEEEYLDELLKSMSFDLPSDDEEDEDDTEEVQNDISEDIEESDTTEDFTEINAPLDIESEEETVMSDFDMGVMEEPTMPELDMGIEEESAMPEFDMGIEEESVMSDFNMDIDDIPDDDVDSKLLNQMLINESDDVDAEELEIDDLLKALQAEDAADDSIYEAVPEPSIIEEDGNEEIILDDDDLLNDLNADIDPSSLFADDFSDLLAFSQESVESEEEKDHHDNNKKSKKKSSKKTEDDDNDNDNDKKKKFSLKKFFMAFDDGDDEPDKKKGKDLNQQLIDEVYGEEGEDKKDLKAEKKAKAKEKKEEKAKEKEKKKIEKQKKKDLAKAEKVKNIDLESQVVISFGRIIRVVLISAIVCVAVILGSKFLSYAGDINSSKKLFNSGSYTAAYERISGLKIKDKDENFYMQARTMASLYQGIESYDNYMKINDETNAISALVKAVSRRYELQDEITKYEIETQAAGVYQRILNALSLYGISEDDALYLNSITNYEEYLNKISSYGGNE